MIHRYKCLHRSMNSNLLMTKKAFFENLLFRLLHVTKNVFIFVKCINIEDLEKTNQLCIQIHCTKNHIPNVRKTYAFK